MSDQRSHSVSSGLTALSLCLLPLGVAALSIVYLLHRG
jgi:hypothetical protein